MDPFTDIIRQRCPPLEPLPTGNEPQLNRLEDVKAVLFDVYGTLFVSGSGDVGTAAATNTADALQHALEVVGFAGDLEQAGILGRDLLKSAILASHETAREQGIPYPEVEIVSIWSEVISQLRSEQRLEPDAPAVDDPTPQLALEYECRVNPVFPMPGADEAIAAIRERIGVMGIVSNAQFYTPLLFSAFFDRSLEELGFDPDCCIWSYRELQAKPSSALFPKAGRCLQEKYGIGLHETLYVGNDMLNDIYCAGAAGCRTVLFAGDRRSLRLREGDERCQGVQPDAVITSLMQLPEIL